MSPLTVAVLSKGSACMTYTPQRLKSLSVYSTPFSSTRPLIDPLPAILHASAFSCSTRAPHALGEAAAPVCMHKGQPLQHNSLHSRCVGHLGQLVGCMVGADSSSTGCFKQYRLTTSQGASGSSEWSEGWVCWYIHESFCTSHITSVRRGEVRSDTHQGGFACTATMQKCQMQDFSKQNGKPLRASLCLADHPASKHRHKATFAFLTRPTGSHDCSQTTSSAGA